MSPCWTQQEDIGQEGPIETVYGGQSPRQKAAGEGNNQHAVTNQPCWGSVLAWSETGVHGLNLQMPGSTKPILYADLVACLGDVSNTPSVCRNNWILFLPFCLTILNNFSLLSGKSNPISQCRWNDSLCATSTLPLNRDLFLKYYRITRSLVRYMQMISSFSVTYFQKEILFPHQMSPHTSKPPIKDSAVF